MTTTRYATPTLRKWGDTSWQVHAHPWKVHVGWIDDVGPVGWEAVNPRGLILGLWPTRQAAAEVLVKQAGYELEMT